MLYGTKRRIKYIFIVIAVIAFAYLTYYYILRPQRVLNQSSLKEVEVSNIIDDEVLNKNTLTQEEKLLRGESDKVLAYLVARNYEKLSEFIHPQKGLRFSSDIVINTQRDQLLTKQSFKSSFIEDKKRFIGTYQKLKASVEVSADEYIDKFIYNLDYLKAKQIEVKVVKGSNLGNLSELFPDSLYVEYMLDGIDPRINGYSKQSLVLTFEKSDKDWFLTGVIHRDIAKSESVSVGVDDSKNLPSMPPKIAEESIKARAHQLILALKNRDTQKLSTYIHPVKGVRMTPFTRVLNDDLVFSAEEMKNYFSIGKEYLWGIFEGIGTPIILNTRDYYTMFIYNDDFEAADTVTYNRVAMSTGFKENQFAAYPGAIVVEYFLKGRDPAYAGKDWSSLRLVFETHLNDWYLTGLIHNQWTP